MVSSLRVRKFRCFTLLTFRRRLTKIYFQQVYTERKMFFVLSRACDKEIILSPHEESALRCSTTEPRRLYGERGPLRSSYVTRVLHTARISDVDSVMFVNRVREMVSFELGKEIEKDNFRHVTSLGQRKKFWVPMKNWTSDLRIPRSDALPLSDSGRASSL